MGIESLQFLQATNPQYYKNLQSHQVNPKQYEQNSNQNVNTIRPLTNEDYEKALAYINGDLKVGANENPFNAQRVNTSENAKGKAFENFKVPEFNGTGELIPDVSNRENSIPDCPWKEYLA